MYGLARPVDGCHITIGRAPSHSRILSQTLIFGSENLAKPRITLYKFRLNNFGFSNRIQCVVCIKVKITSKTLELTTAQPCQRLQQKVSNAKIEPSSGVLQGVPPTRIIKLNFIRVLIESLPSIFHLYHVLPVRYDT